MTNHEKEDQSFENTLVKPEVSIAAAYNWIQILYNDLTECLEMDEDPDPYEGLFRMMVNSLSVVAEVASQISALYPPNYSVNKDEMFKFNVSLYKASRRAAHMVENYRDARTLALGGPDKATRIEAWKTEHDITAMLDKPGKGFNFPVVLVRNYGYSMDGGYIPYLQGGYLYNTYGRAVLIPNDSYQEIADDVYELYKLDNPKEITLQDLQVGDIFLSPDFYLAEVTNRYVNDDGEEVLTWVSDLDGEVDDMADMEVECCAKPVVLLDRQKDQPKNND